MKWVLISIIVSVLCSVGYSAILTYKTRKEIIDIYYGVIDIDARLRATNRSLNDTIFKFNRLVNDVSCKTK